MHDLEKLAKKEVSPQAHLSANSFLSLATSIVSLSLAIALYAVLGFRPDTHWLIYLVSGFLIAITAWQVQTFIRTRMLKKQFEKLRPEREPEDDRSAQLENPGTERLLNNALFSGAVPPSITENTTRNIRDKIPVRSSKAKH